MKKVTKKLELNKVSVAELSDKSTSTGGFTWTILEVTIAITVAISKAGECVTYNNDCNGTPTSVTFTDGKSCL